MQYLSASRIKTLQTCSWQYYVNYILNLKDEGNPGSKMGSLVHVIYECLGNPRHKKHYDDLLSSQKLDGSKVIKRYIERGLKKNGLDESYLPLVDTMLIEGINYDFFGQADGEPTESFSELNFDIQKKEGGKNYRIMGFIDKLFLYKESCAVKIRDFKSSKRQFEGKDIDDNIQDLMYRLAVKYLYPEYLRQKMEFVFLQFDCKEAGVVKTPDVSDEELEGFEHFLTEIQQLVDNFDERAAKSNLAYDKGYPPKEDGFAGRLVCGRADRPDAVKKDGSAAWFCGSKFAYEYWAVLEKDKVIKTFKTEKEARDFAGERKIKRMLCKGCPAFKFLEYNQVFIQNWLDKYGD